MGNILWFDVSALCVLAPLLRLYYVKFNAPLKKYVVFLAMVWLSLCAATASLCSHILPGTAPAPLLWLSGTVYYLAQGLMLPTLLLYVYSLTDPGLGGWKELIPWLVPTAFQILLVLTNWYSGALFRLDAGSRLCPGPQTWLVYLIAAHNFAGIVVRLARTRRLIPSRERGLVILFLAATLTARAVQLLFPWLLVENFANALCVMVFQLGVQNPELILDGSTGMLNKRGFSLLLSPLFDQRQSIQVGFLMVDNYHELEKVYGYTRLESRISVLTNFLKQHTGVIFARMDSDLFCFVPENLQPSQAWTELVQDLDEETLIARLHRRRIGVRVQMKMGLLHCPQDAESFSELLELLDLAAQLPMGQGQDAFRLRPVDVVNLRRRKLIMELVRGAVKDNSLSMVYQPIYDLHAGRFCSAEALMRMHTEKTGDVPPDEFIRIAEDSGANRKLTRFAAETVCRFLRSASQKGLKLHWVNINLSAMDCAQEDLADQLLKIIRDYQVEPGMLSAEITETAFANPSGPILDNLTSLSRSGVTIMLDDYGTGYSNLNRLCAMPLDVVKLDKSLVDQVCTCESARVVMESTIAMMKRLNKKVLVEGVETKEQVDYLIEQDVDYIQGYYFARPMDEAHLEALFLSQTEPV